MNKQPLLDLATHLEGLDGPCRETDARIYNALSDDKTTAALFEPMGEWFIYEVHAEGGDWLSDLPVFTSSRDASASLMPDGWIVDDISEEDGGGRFTVGLGKSYEGVGKSGEAKTEPNARTAAALRAIASEL